MHQEGDGARRWQVGERHLVNGDIMELAIEIPALWLPVWIEGLPGAPAACMTVRQGQVTTIALYPGTRLRWPERASSPLIATAQLRTQQATLRDLRGSFTNRIDDPARLTRDLLQVLEGQSRYLHAFCKETIACVYPDAVRRVEKEVRGS